MGLTEIFPKNPLPKGILLRIMNMNSYKELAFA